MPDEIAADWAEFLPTHLLWHPLAQGDAAPVGALLMARGEPWQEGDLQLAAPLLGTYTQSLLLQDRAPKPLDALARGLRQRRSWLIGAAAILALALVAPVRQSVLAPAEIVPVDPAPIRAPFDGLVDELHVTPNQPVKAGQRLVSLDRTQLDKRRTVTQKALDMAREEYADTAQEAMNDPKAKAKLAILASKVEQQQAELDYDREMLGRAEIVAPADGIAVFDDANEWAGKPVALGERILLVASPSNTQLEIQVPVAEVVSFEPGSEVVFFSNLAPDRPVSGQLAFASYASAVTAEGVLAYSFRSRFDPDVPPQRLGFKGTAKIYGPRRPLALWLFRRPIALVREWLSL
jgi:multidrug resistance efflux pump